MTAVWAGQCTGQFCQLRRWLQLELAEGIPPRDQAEQTRATGEKGTSLPSWERGKKTGLCKVSVHGNGWLNSMLVTFHRRQEKLHMVFQAKACSTQDGFQAKCSVREKWSLTNFWFTATAALLCLHFTWQSVISRGREDHQNKLYTKSK